MKRAASVDIFRALTMLAMLWVNDFAGMEGIPHWLGHAAGREDMLGFSDIVFPTFLFCMGMSIPLALDKRLSNGSRLPGTIFHIILRSAALIIMGVYELNAHSSGSEQMTALAVFLIWCDYPRCGSEDKRRYLFCLLRLTGIMILVAIAVRNWPLRTEWWGILGLIGWAYLFSAIIYLAVRKVRVLLPVAWAAVIVLVLLSKGQSHLLDGIPGGWTHICLAFSGVVCSCAARELSGKKGPSAFPIAALCAASVALVAGIICHPHWIISKIFATPTWMFFCLAIDFAAMAALNYIADHKGWVKWARPIKAAGVSTLTCYMLPYIWYPLSDFTKLGLPEAFYSGIPGLLKALAFAFLIILIAELLGKLRIRLKI